MSQCFLLCVVMANLFFQIMNSVAAVGASFFVPVSIVVSVILSSQLVINMIIFGDLLRTEKFPKEVRIGTCVVAIATILHLMQENQDIIDLISHPSSVLLIAVNSIIILLAFPLMVLKDMRFARVKASDGYASVEYSTLSFITIFLTQSILQVIQRTASKMFVLVSIAKLVIALNMFAVMTVMQVFAILQ